MPKINSVLIVDDDEDDCQIFADSIREFDPNITCIVACDGQLALDILADTNQVLPSLIFLDLRMPKYGGKKCLIDLKTNEATKDIPVIIYTSSRSLIESAELKQLGALHFITKPNNPEEMFYILSVVLEETERLSGNFDTNT